MYLLWILASPTREIIANCIGGLGGSSEKNVDDNGLAVWHGLEEREAHLKQQHHQRNKDDRA